MVRAYRLVPRTQECLSTRFARIEYPRGYLDGAELRWIDAELERVDAARTWLISRRAALLDELSAIRRQSARPAPARPAPRGRPISRPEMSVRTAARLLLAAGAALVRRRLAAMN
jgi:hypothetical protein